MCRSPSLAAWSLLIYHCVRPTLSFTPVQPFKVLKSSSSSLSNLATLLPLPYKHVISSTSLMNSRCDVYAMQLSSKQNRWGGFIIGPIVRYLINLIGAALFNIIFRLLNRFHTVGRETFLSKYVFGRPSGRGLITVSNHLSVIDDPGLWAAMLPIYRMRPNQIRWSLCTEGVFFGGGLILSRIFGAANVLPLDRSGSLDQPMFQLFQRKLNQGSWTHVFAEGRVWQRWRFNETEPRLGPFKVGVGRLIAHSTSNPFVVPMYHQGLDQVVPEKELKDKKSRKPSKPISLFPKVGKRITLYIGEAVDFNDELAAFDMKYGQEMRRGNRATPELLQLYSDLADRVRNEVLKLEILSRKDYP